MTENNRYVTALRTLYLNDNKLKSLTETVRSFTRVSINETHCLFPELQSLDLRGNEFIERLSAASTSRSQLKGNEKTIT